MSVLSPDIKASPDPSRWRALGVLAVMQFILVLDTTVVNVALPSIQRDLHFSTSGLAWVVNSYALMAGGFLILGGRVADIFGRRRLFLGGLAVFAVASIMSGLAQDPAMLVAARFGQGLGEAVASPAGLSLAVLMFDDPKERARAVGTWGGLSVLGGTSGVVLSGIITTYVGWRWVFLINIPIAAIVLGLVPRMVKESHSSTRQRIDVAGAVLITASLVLAVYGLLQASTHAWGDGAVVIPLAVGGVLLVAFIVSQALIPSPLVTLRFFRNRTRVIANFGSMLMTASYITMIFVFTLYLQDIAHYSPVKTGLAYLPFGAAVLAGVLVSAQILPRIGVKSGLTLGFLIMAGGLALLTQISVHADYPAHILPGFLVIAFGSGVVFPALNNAALHEVGPADAGLASGVENTFFQFGGSLGLAALVTLALRHAASRISQGVSAAAAATIGYQLAIWAAAGLCVFAALLIALGLERVTFVPADQQALAVAEADADISPAPASPDRRETNAER